MMQRQLRHSQYSLLVVLLWAGLISNSRTSIADDEFCGTCGPQVSVSGSFTHHKDNARVAIEGAGDNAAFFREDVNGPDFTVSIATLPAGKYTVTVSAADTTATAAGERVFTIISGDATLA